MRLCGSSQPSANKQLSKPALVEWFVVALLGSRYPLARHLGVTKEIRFMWLLAIDSSASAIPILEWKVNVIDLIALVSAFFAIGLAVYEMRRNSSVVISLVEATHQAVGRVGVRGGKLVHELTIVVRNDGVALHDVRAYLEFSGERPHFGHCSIPLKVNNEVYGDGAFTRGMIAAFSWSELDLDGSTIRSLKLLRDCRKQRATFRLYSQRYLAYSHSVAATWARARAYVNQWLSLANRMSHRRIGKNEHGHDVVEAVLNIPTFINVERNLMSFIEALDVSC